MVNRGFVVGVQGARWEDLVGYKACDLGSIGMIMWVVVLHWVRVCLVPANCFNSFFAWMHFSTCFVYDCLCALCHGTKNIDCYQWICIFVYF